MTQRRILLADDHPLFRDALRAAISRLWPECLIDEADSLGGASALLHSNPLVDLVLLDLKLPDCEGFSGLLALRAEFSQAPVVIVSATEDAATVSNAIAAGAQGFIPKSAPLNLMAQALEAIMGGDVWTPPDLRLTRPSKSIIALASLSPAQARILSCLKRGLLNKQIAFELGVTEATVKAHMTATFRKLGVVNRTQALVLVQTAYETGPEAEPSTPAA